MSQGGGDKSGDSDSPALSVTASLFPQLEQTVLEALDLQNKRQRTRPQPLNVIPDEPDLRDMRYSPGLIPLANEVPIPDYLWPIGSLCTACKPSGHCRQSSAESSTNGALSPARLEHMRRRLIRNQRGEGSCTGQALASVIDILLLRSEFGRPTGCYQNLIQQSGYKELWHKRRASARMLYEMARNYEYAPESQLPGSTVRNALKAFHHNGVCSEHESEYIAGDLDWTLTIKRAINARDTRLGTYYRLNNDILDWQAALNEVGALLVSAIIHEGWNNLVVPENSSYQEQSGGLPRTSPNQIAFDNKPVVYLGGHAFAVVGYNEHGFYVLNSWGGNWGRVLDKNDQTVRAGVPGVALWKYEDWQQHVFDAWVFRLAHKASSRVGRMGGWRQQLNPISGQKMVSEPRQNINGHYLNLCSSGYVRRGKYPSDANTSKETSDHLKSKERRDDDGKTDPYRALVICFMNGSANINSDARRVDGLTWLFKQERLYPYFIYWNYADVSHLTNIIDANYKTLLDRYGSSDQALHLRFDRELREFGKLFKTRMFDQLTLLTKPGKTAPLFDALDPLLKWSSEFAKPIHFLAHSDGARLLTGFLQNLKTHYPQRYKQVRSTVASYYLLAPTATEYELKGIRSCRTPKAKINLLTLSDEEELADRIGCYQAGFPRLMQNVFFHSEKERSKKNVLGLPENARKLVITAGGNPSSVYRHLEAPRSSMRTSSRHFEIMGNQILMESIVEEMSGTLDAN